VIMNIAVQRALNECAKRLKRRLTRRKETPRSTCTKLGIEKPSKGVGGPGNLKAWQDRTAESITTDWGC
jgi:hypothetical protein